MSDNQASCESEPWMTTLLLLLLLLPAGVSTNTRLRKGKSSLYLYSKYCLRFKMAADVIFPSSFSFCRVRRTVWTGVTLTWCYPVWSTTTTRGHGWTLLWLSKGTVEKLWLPRYLARAHGCFVSRDWQANCLLRGILFYTLLKDSQERGK